MLNISELIFRYTEAEQNTIGPLNLEVNPGEILVILGESGHGKSTLLRLIAGLEKPDAGEIKLEDELLANTRKSLPPEARKIGMVFQDYALFPHMTIEKNIRFGLREKHQSIEELIQFINLQELIHRHPHQLSGGEQQRVALARALAPKPKIILLDEPFSNLDPKICHQLCLELRSILKHYGCSAILVTHDQERAMELADRIAILRQGSIEQIDTPSEIYLNPQTKYTAEFIGVSSFIDAEIENNNLKTIFGNLHHNSSNKIKSGKLLVRPENLILSEKETSDSIKVEVISTYPQKIANMNILKLTNGEQVKFIQLGPVPLQIGSTVNLKLNIPNPVIFNSDEIHP